jgi:hypothetical protein
VCNWLGTAVCVLLAALFIASGWRSPTCQFPFGTRRGCITLYRGALFAGVDDVDITSMAWGEEESHPFPPPQAWLTWTRRFELGRASLWLARRDAWTVHIPLWMPLAVLLLPTLWLWYRDRRRIPPGHCQTCAYNLTGNVSGRCPECGAAVGRNAA